MKSWALIGVGIGFCGFLLNIIALVAPVWSISLPQTDSGQFISIRAYQGLWQQCVSSSNGFTGQCSRYWQGIAHLARIGLVGQRIIVMLSVILSFLALIRND